MKKKKNLFSQREDISVINADPHQGLTHEQAQRRAEGGWSNAVTDSAQRTEGQIVLHHCITFFNLVFVVLAAVLVFSGSSIKNMTFLVVVVINTVIGIVQEIRAKRAVEKLTLVAAAQLKAIRNGKGEMVRSDLLVRDDIVEFGPGDQICADGVVRLGEMQVNESLITGEADPITKKPGDQLRSGSFVLSGRGRVQLTQVGNDGYAARLGAEAKNDPHAAKSEMMRSLDRLIQVVGIALIPIGVILFYQEYNILKLGLTQSAEATVAALVGMIPEGLYLLTSVAMAVSALKLTKQRVLVQDMNCIETLARVDVLCVDKTGTITEAAMEVEDVVRLTDAHPHTPEAILTALYGDMEPDNETGKALAARFSGVSDFMVTRRIPFSSQSKWMGAVFEDRGAYLVGAPEFIMGSRKEEILPFVAPYAANGSRVLLLAHYDGDPDPKGLEEEKLTPLALVLMANRIRLEAPETFAYFVEQGVSIRVISGDNPAAVSEVARKAGISGAEKYIDASVLETEKDFLKAVDSYTVFGRVTPEKKKALIRAFRKKKHTVAMTGDGVNDVLAMREANCGIAMASGAQAASQVAQLVLLDSDFSAMPGIVGEGRRVINNIQRAATLFLVKNIFSLGLALISFLTSWPYPLEPLHLSVISALTIGVPSFFLAMEPNYERISGRFLAGVLRRAFPGGLTNIFVVLAAQAYMAVFGLSLEQTSTICAAILGIVGLLVLFQTCKPFDRFRRLIWWAMALGLVLSFTLLNGLLDLRTGDIRTLLIMVTLLIMTPTVFFAIQRLFDWGDRIYARLTRRREKKHADL